MFNELDELMKITKLIEATSGKAEETEDDDTEDTKSSKKKLGEDDDIGGIYINKHFGDEPYEAEDTTEWTEIKGSDEESDDEESAEKQDTESDSDDDDAPVDAAEGSSSNINPDKEPIFEEIPDDDGLEQAMGEGLGLRGSFHKALHSFESCADCPCMFNVGDTVRMKSGPSTIFIIKSNDGDMMTAAQPTANKAMFASGTEGKWPVFYFNQDEIEPMEKVALNTLDDLNNIIAFNDMPINECGLTGNTIVDTDNYKEKQKVASGNQYDRKIDEVWEDMFGTTFKDCMDGKCGSEYHDATTDKFDDKIDDYSIDKLFSGTIFDK